MSFIRITVNDEVLMDGELNQWSDRPPKFIEDMKDMIHPNSITRPATHMQCVAIAFGMALAKGADIVIDVVTSPGSWAMTVKEG